MDLPWSPSVLGLDALQASLVALPAVGLPWWLRRLSNSWWALVPVGLMVVVIYAVTAIPGLAAGPTWIALLAYPPLAMAALGWAMHGARPVYALAVPPLLIGAWVFSDALGGHMAAAAITALSCVTLARLLQGVAPAVALKAGIVVMAVVDAILILGEQLQEPNRAINAAAPPADLPRMQVAIIDPASLGYGDLFLAALLGALIAAEAGRRAQLRMVPVLFVLIAAFDTLFLVLDVLPATVPVAVALGVWEVGRRRWPRTLGACRPTETGPSRR